MRKNRVVAALVPEPDIFTDEGEKFAVGVRNEKDFFSQVRAKLDAAEGKAPTEAVVNLSFESPEQLLEILSAKRLELFKSVREHGSFASIEELATMVHRDRSTVSKDVRELAAIGLFIVKKSLHPGHGQRSSISTAGKEIRIQFAL